MTAGSSSAAGRWCKPWTSTAGNYVDAGMGLASALVPGGAAAAGRVTGRAANNVGNKLANGLGTVAKGISRHTACDAPTFVGRIVGNLLGRCFVYETELVYDRLPEEASTNSGMAFSLLRLEFVAAAAVVVVSGTLLEVRRQKAKREAEQEFEQLLDQLFDSGEWNEADSEETQLSSVDESAGLEDAPHISDDFLPWGREGDYDANMKRDSKDFFVDDVSAERHELASATATVTAVGTARRVQRPSHMPQVKTTKSRWSAIALWAILLFGLAFGGHSLWGMLANAPSEVKVGQGPGRRFVTQPIGAARPGEWILAKNPRGAEDEDVEITDPSAWRLVKLLIADSFGWQVEIETLQQVGVLEEAAAEVGSLIEVELLELDAEGEATVVSINPCPPIKPRPSAEHHLIVSKFRRRATNVIQVHVAGQEKPLGVTANHPFWSADRQDFVEAGQLRPGENATDPDGRLIQIASLDLTPRTAEVFNVEVAGEHVYHVTDAGIAVHNRCLGAQGEQWARGWLQKNGYEILGTVKNNSGHGLDIVARQRSTGILTIVEVKTSRNGWGRLSQLQSLGSRNYANDVLRRANNNAGHWAPQNITPGTLAWARQLQGELRAGGATQGLIIKYNIAARKILTDPTW